MDLNNLLKPYKRKITAESILKACLLAVVVGLIVAVALLSGIAALLIGFDLINKVFPIIRTQQMVYIVSFLLGGGGTLAIIITSIVVALITGLIAFLLFQRKATQNLAQKVDALGLNERVITMVEYQEDKSYVAHVQRQDAVEKLAAFDMSTVQVKPQKSKLISAVALLLASSILCSFVLIYKFDPSTLALHVHGTTKISRDLIGQDNQDLLDKIEDIIEADPPVSEDKKDDLNDIKDNLDNKLDEALGDENKEPADILEDKKDALEGTMNELDKLVKEEQNYILQIIDACKGRQDTASLGVAMEMLNQAVENGEDTEEAIKYLESVIGGMKELALNSANYYDALVNSLNVVIEEADLICKIPTEEPHALKTALQGFCENLEYLRDEVDVDGADLDTVEKAINKKFDESKEDIIEAIEDIDDLKEKVDDIKNEIKKELEEVEDDLEKEQEKEELEQEQEKVEEDFNEIEDIIDGSDMNEQDKEDLKQDMEDLEQDVEDALEQKPTLKEEIDRIMNDENKTDEEKKEDLKDIVDENDEGLTEEEKEQIKDSIDDILDQKPTLDEEIDRIVDDENKTNEEKADDLKDIVDRNDEGLTEEEKEQIKDRIDDIMNDPNKSDEEKKEDLKDAMENVESNYNNQTEQDKKEDIYDSMKPVEDNYNENQENKTNEDKKQEASDAIKDKQDALDKEVEQDKESVGEIAGNLKDNDLKDSDDETEKELGDALEDLGNALEKGDSDAMKDAMDRIEDIINGKDPETGEDKGLTDDQKQDLADKVANELQNAASPAKPSDTKDAFEDLAEDLKNNSQNAEDNGTSFEEELGNAFDKAEGSINDAKNETQTKEEVSDKLGDIRDDLVGDNKSEIDDMLGDIREEINNSDLTPGAKDEANDVLDDLEGKLEDMVQNGATDSEISSEIQNAKDKIDNIIQNDKNNELGTSDSMKDNNTTSDIQDAIQSGDKEALDEAFKDLENQLKDSEGNWLKGEALDKVLGDMAEDFKNAADALPEGDLKDAMGDLADSFENAKQEAAKNDNYTPGTSPEQDAENGQYDENAKNEATGALDQAKQEISDFMGKLENMEQTGENVSDRFQQAQGAITGEQPPQSEENPEGGENSDQNSNQNSDQNSDQNSNQNSDSSQGGESESESDKENESDSNQGEGEGEQPQDPTQQKPGGDSEASDGEEGNGDFFIPGDPDDFMGSGALEDEYDKMFGRPLTPEEREAIEKYYASLKGNS